MQDFEEDIFHELDANAQKAQKEMTNFAGWLIAVGFISIAVAACVGACIIGLIKK